MSKETYSDFCSTCETNVKFESVAEYKFIEDDGCPEEYTLAKCIVCNNPALFYREDPEFFEALYGEHEYPKVMVWPREHDRTLSFHVPHQVEVSYLEAVEAIKSNLFLSASVMIGRALEAACLDYDSSIKTIHQGLRKMKDDGALSDEMHEWASALRVLRNQGAHANQIKFKPDDIEYALDFLEAILEIIYDIRPKFKRFQSAEGS